MENQEMGKLLSIFLQEQGKFEQRISDIFKIGVESLQERCDTFEENTVTIKGNAMDFLHRQESLENALIALIGRIDRCLDNRANIFGENIKSFHKDFNNIS